jgi:hypothetical protein
MPPSLLSGSDPPNPIFLNLNVSRSLAPQYHQADWIFKPENNRIVSGVDVVALHLSLAI